MVAIRNHALKLLVVTAQALALPVTFPLAAQPAFEPNQRSQYHTEPAPFGPCADFDQHFMV